MLNFGVILINEFQCNNNNNNNNRHLNTKYKEDQFVNIVKNHESTQLNMNSILKLAAKIITELSQLNGKNDAKHDEMQHTKERLGEVLKKN
jgi:hypothetical protein